MMERPPEVDGQPGQPPVQIDGNGAGPSGNTIDLKAIRDRVQRRRHQEAAATRFDKAPAQPKKKNREEKQAATYIVKTDRGEQINKARLASFLRDKFWPIYHDGGRAGEFWQYLESRGVWVELPESAVRHACASELGDLVTPRHVSDAVQLLKDLVYLPAEETETAPMMLNLVNGMFDISAMRRSPQDPSSWLLSHGPKYYSKIQLPVSYRPDVGQPALFLETMQGIFADNPDKIQIIRQFAAYCLVPKIYFPAVLFQIGSGGNGKSVLEDVLGALLGQENVSHVSLKRLENRFGIVELKGKLLNSCGETESGVLDVTSLKEVTTGQEVQAEQKYAGDVKFKPMAKFLISINAFPKIRERSDALWRRIIPVEYSQHFGTGEGCRPKIDRIQERIIATELDAVFLWALEVLPAVLDSGKIAIPETCSMDFDNFKSAINPLFDFAREALVFHENATVKPPDLYKVYQAWAKDGGTNRPIGKHGFYEQIRLHYRTVRRVRPMALPGQQSSVEVFQGVGILDGTPWAPTT